MPTPSPLPDEQPRAFATRLLTAVPSYGPERSYSPIRPLRVDPSNAEYFSHCQEGIAEFVAGPECAGVAFLACPSSSSSEGEESQNARETFRDFIWDLERILGQQGRHSTWTTAQKLILFSSLVHGKPREWLENLATENEAQLWAQYNAKRKEYNLWPLSPPPQGMPLAAKLMYEPTLFIMKVWPAFVQAFRRHFDLPSSQHSAEVTHFDRRLVATSNAKERHRSQTSSLGPTTTLTFRQPEVVYTSPNETTYTEFVERNTRQSEERRCAVRFDCFEPRQPLTPQEEYRYIN